MEKVTKKLPEETVDYLQMLSYEANGLMVLHSHALGAGVPKEKVEEIRALFLEKNAEYRLAAQEVVNEYSEGAAVKNWHIDFAEGGLTFEE